ncbi:MAG: hypothetical protein H2069_01910 [Legionella sp.]|nr:hypothetical protein [Legionella sp.]
MDTGSLILSHPQIHFSVRGPNRNGSQSVYLSTECSVLEFRITDIDCLEKDFDKLWQALSVDLTQMITRIFEKGIDYNPNKTRCVSWKNDKLDLVKQMQSLAKGDCIDYTLDKKYFQETNLDELASIEEPITLAKPAHSDELISVDKSVPNLYGLFASSSLVESKASEKSCSGCNLI